MGCRVGVDIGGTFTDFCVFDEETKALHFLKVLSTPGHPGGEVLEGLRVLKERHGIAPSEIEHFTHGTTVGINTVIQRSGASLCLFATENFCDVLELARLRMPEVVSLYSRRPAPLIGRDKVLPLRERILSDGRVDLPLDEASVLAAIAEARALGVEGIVICLLNAYCNSVHERLARSIVEREAPELFVFTSADVWPVIREYERTVTTAINGYIHPRVSRYLTSLAQALKSEGVPADPLITKSNGGVMRAENGKSSCVAMVLSGTASGVIGACFVAEQAGVRNALTLDIGGTSADVALILDGKAQYGTGERIGDFPLFIPSVSVTSIGGGGGSIAWVDTFGVLRVGPESAGSEPGPACYGRGGTRPTVTDAFTVCGFLGHRRLGYDAVGIDKAKAETVIGDLAGKLGRPLQETAEAVIRIAVSGMYMEINKLVARYGIDPRDVSLLTFGGAGPMIGCFLARELGMDEILVPVAPGVVSALGGLVADMRNDFIETIYQDLSLSALPRLQASMKSLKARAAAWLGDEQRFTGPHVLTLSADMNYKGQSFEIEVPIKEQWIGEKDIGAIEAAFHARHHAMYGISDAKAAVRLINLRAVIAGANPKPEFRNVPPDPTATLPATEVAVFFDGRDRRIPRYERRDLRPGMTFTSPAIVSQDDTTLCIPDGYGGRVDAVGNIVLRRVATEASRS